MRGDVIQIRVSAEEKAAFREAAKREGIRLSDWIRLAATAAAREAMKGTPATGKGRNAYADVLTGQDRPENFGAESPRMSVCGIDLDDVLPPAPGGSPDEPGPENFGRIENEREIVDVSGMEEVVEVRAGGRTVDMPAEIAGAPIRRASELPRPERKR